MSLARMALRLLTVQCLLGDESSRPTIAADRVFDSRVGAIDLRDPNDRKPYITVVTDDDEGEPLESGMTPGAPWLHQIDLVIEIGVAAFVQDDRNELEISFGPETDGEMEAMLDVAEFQVWRRLGFEPGLSVQWRRLAKPIRKKSYRQVDDDAHIKMALRRAAYSCQVMSDCIVINPASSEGFDVLPEPLRSVASYLPAQSAGFETVTAVANALSPITAVPFLRVHEKFDPKAVPDEAQEPHVEAIVDLPQ